MNKRLCFDCVFFAPEGKRINDLTEDQWDEGITGECRRHCPVALEPDEDGRIVNYAYWPIVLASDWCGELKPRAEATA